MDMAENRGQETAREFSLLEALTSGFIEEKSTADIKHQPILIQNRSGNTFRQALEEELTTCTDFYFSVAFISDQTLLSLKTKFDQFKIKNNTSSSPRTGHIITSTFNFFNEPSAFKELLKISRDADIQVKVWSPSQRRTSQSAQVHEYPFHAKGYFFTHTDADVNEKYSSLYIGSSNLTNSALEHNREWNLRVTTLDNGYIARQIREEIGRQERESSALTDEWIAEYSRLYEIKKRVTRSLSAPLIEEPIRPNSMQQEALLNLSTLREQNESRAIIISATGTGKTYLSAFDVRAAHPHRMLYIAHQEQILKSARRSYKKVLSLEDKDLGLLTGTSKQNDRRFIFSTVQTMSNEQTLRQFRPDDFDYIIIDEVHHAAATSYKKIIDYFKPGFLLGMTATPERTDGADIFGLFGNNVAYEIRLKKALEANLLVPFQYYGVAEYLGDSETLRISEAAPTDITQLKQEVALLTQQDRVRYIIDKIQNYSAAGVHVHGLVFCSHIEEAEKLSELFNENINQMEKRRYRTACVSGKTSKRDLEEIISDFESGCLDYIFAVDLFNEGIDIPCINQIVMLRSTQSSIIFTQQLGRGLRRSPETGKKQVIVIDFIGNYANNYMIPLALYGNRGEKDIVRKELARTTIGLCGISFEKIAYQRVLKSIQHADLSKMAELTNEYRNLRFQLNRIPMLTDFLARDSISPTILASKKNDYLSFVESREKSLTSGRNSSAPLISSDLFATITEDEHGILKFLTSAILPGLRPQEAFILNELISSGAASTSERIITATLKLQFPEFGFTEEQTRSACRNLDLSYFLPSNAKLYGGKALIDVADSGRISLSEVFKAALTKNLFRRFAVDTISAGLQTWKNRYAAVTEKQLSLSHGFIYGEKYSLAEITRFLCWENEQVPQNIGGYKLDRGTNTLPIFVKYAASQYADKFLSPQEMLWYSKDRRSLSSPEFVWLNDNSHDHFIPLFIRRKDAGTELDYYFVGEASIEEATETTRKGTSINLVKSRLRLSEPVTPDLYHHLTGETAL